jgi:hypothetical protein
MATRFHDRHEWITFLKAQEVARRIVADPSMIDDASWFIDRFMRPDPHRGDYVVSCWRNRQWSLPPPSRKTAGAGVRCRKLAPCSAMV